MLRSSSYQQPVHDANKNQRNPPTTQTSLPYQPGYAEFAIGPGLQLPAESDMGQPTSSSQTQAYTPSYGYNGSLGYTYSHGYHQQHQQQQKSHSIGVGPSHDFCKPGETVLFNDPMEQSIFGDPYANTIPASSRAASGPNEWSASVAQNQLMEDECLRDAQTGRPLFTPQLMLKYHSDKLTPYEMLEIQEFPHIFYFGQNVIAEKGVRGKRYAVPENPTSNYGYDDERGDYLLTIQDHIAYRYEIVDMLGKGSFGQVVKVLDYRTNKMMAVKIIRNKKRFHHQALVEVKVLQKIKDEDRSDTSNIIKIQDSFYFRGHLCIVFELLSMNLYEFIKSNGFRGFSISLIRRFTVQILYSLSLLRRNKIVHCDLKPENILLCSNTKSLIKVIDFGSSCYENERIYTYIQSRFYRSPEVILGMEYGMPIDMWSLGCILAELYTGYPLFPGENEVEQIQCIMEVLGVPPIDIIQRASRRKLFFHSNFQPRISANSKGKFRKPGSKPLEALLKCNGDKVVHQQFINFIRRCLEWDPEKRILPEEALTHTWIAVPSDVKSMASTVSSLSLNQIPQSMGSPSSVNVPRSSYREPVRQQNMEFPENNFDAASYHRSQFQRYSGSSSTTKPTYAKPASNQIRHNNHVSSYEKRLPHVSGNTTVTSNRSLYGHKNYHQYRPSPSHQQEVVYNLGTIGPRGPNSGSSGNSSSSFATNLLNVGAKLVGGLGLTRNSTEQQQQPAVTGSKAMKWRKY